MEQAQNLAMGQDGLGQHVKARDMMLDRPDFDSLSRPRTERGAEGKKSKEYYL